MKDDLEWLQDLEDKKDSSKTVRDVLTHLNEKNKPDFEMRSVLVDSFALTNVFVNLMLRTEINVYEPSIHLISGGRRSIEHAITPIVFELPIPEQCKEM